VGVFPMLPSPGSLLTAWPSANQLAVYPESANQVVVGIYRYEHNLSQDGGLSSDP
jgi:hypothetical protein